MVRFKNDKAVVTLNSLCNSADPTQPMDAIDGLVRFCKYIDILITSIINFVLEKNVIMNFFVKKVIYFALNNDPSLTSQNYIGATIDFDPNTVYVGQLLFTTGTSLPTTSPAVNSIYSYVDTSTSNLTITGRSFGVINFVIKIPPSSLYGFNIESCI